MTPVTNTDNISISTWPRSLLQGQEKNGSPRIATPVSPFQNRKYSRMNWQLIAGDEHTSKTMRGRAPARRVTWRPVVSRGMNELVPH